MYEYSIYSPLNILSCWKYSICCCASILALAEHANFPPLKTRSWNFSSSEDVCFCAEFYGLDTYIRVNYVYLTINPSQIRTPVRGMRAVKMKRSLKKKYGLTCLSGEDDHSTLAFPLQSGHTTMVSLGTWHYCLFHIEHWKLWKSGFHCDQ